MRSANSAQMKPPMSAMQPPASHAPKNQRRSMDALGDHIGIHEDPCADDAAHHQHGGVEQVRAGGPEIASNPGWSEAWVNSICLARTNLKRRCAESIANLRIDSLQSEICYGGPLMKKVFCCRRIAYFPCSLLSCSSSSSNTQAPLQPHQRQHRHLPAVVTLNRNRPKQQIDPCSLFSPADAQVITGVPMKLVAWARRHRLHV